MHSLCAYFLANRTKTKKKIGIHPKKHCCAVPSVIIVARGRKQQDAITMFSLEPKGNHCMKTPNKTGADNWSSAPFTCA